MRGILQTSHLELLIINLPVSNLYRMKDMNKETIQKITKEELIKLDKEIQRLAKLIGNEMKRRNQR